AETGRNFLAVGGRFGRTRNAGVSTPFSHRRQDGAPLASPTFGQPERIGAARSGDRCVGSAERAYIQFDVSAGLWMEIAGDGRPSRVWREAGIFRRHAGCPCGSVGWESLAVGPIDEVWSKPCGIPAGC